MPISNPTQLLDAFKKSGEFDRLRRDLLVSFQNGVRALSTLLCFLFICPPGRNELIH